MAKRKRDVPVLFYVSKDEMALIQQKMQASGTSNMSAYLRKMAIDGYVLKLDLPELKELVSLLRRWSWFKVLLHRRRREASSFSSGKSSLRTYPSMAIFRR